MNKFLRFSLLVIGLGFLFSTLFVRESHGQNVLREILKRMDAHNNALQTLKADVTMVKYDATLKVTDTRTGSTSYLPAKKKGKRAFRLDWATENGRALQETIAVIGDDVEAYQPRLHLVRKGRTQQSKGSKGLGSAFGFLSMSKAEINANYDVVYLGDEQIKTGERTWHLQLTPYKAANYKNAEIWVDKDGMPRQMKINEVNNDYSAILLSAIIKNDTIDIKIFKNTYPAGTKVDKF